MNKIIELHNITKSFDGEVVLVRSGSEPVKMPLTHGYKGSPHYGEPENHTAGGHRGLGAAEMAWSIRLGREHRASKEMGLHTLEVLSGLDVASAEERTYHMTTTFQQPRALPAGYYATEMSGQLRSDGEIALTL